MPRKRPTAKQGRKVLEKPPGTITTNQDGTFDLNVDPEEFKKFCEANDREADRALTQIKGMFPGLF